MLYRIFILLLFCLQTVFAYTQDSLRYTTRWHIGTSFGYNTTLQPFFKGEITDPLIDFNDHTFCWQFLSVSYFFSKHWGVSLNGRGHYTQKASKKAGQFNQQMQAQYGNNYYVNSYADDQFADQPIHVGKMGEFFLNAVYRKEWSRFFIYPKLGIGITSFTTNIGSVSLKQKNSNDQFDVYFKSTDGAAFFTLAASALAGYKLSQKFFLHIEPLATHYNANFNYTQTTTNQNTQESTTDVISYRRNMFSVSLSAGLTYIIR